ncbi:MAG: hypothetical protein CMJ64_12625 [Planctomycetaceae bacterium]|nr:hypothetical protein [Planctomycetaceae bacterium]
MKAKRLSLCLLGALTLTGFAMPPTAAGPREAEPASGITLSANTPSSSISTFALGEQVKLSFRAAGMKPGQDDLKLALHFVDEMDQTVKKQSLEVKADADGDWVKEVAAPCAKMGFWRVFVALSNGVTLPKEGVSQRGGYITYAVVPDPTKRKLYGEKETFFGMNGLFSRQANVMPYLGLRWMYEPSTIAVRQYGYAWGQMEPDHPGQFAEDRAAARAQGKRFPLNLFVHNSAYFVNGQRKPWKVYSLPTLFYAPPQWAIIEGTTHGVHAQLKPEAEHHWRNYCMEAAKAYSEQYPDREENIYQITWEPQGPAGDERLVRTYDIAYKALHKADPKAMVIGPASSNTMLSVAWEERLLSKGLGKYLDGYSIHHYLSRVPNDPGDLSKTPEQNGMIEGLRAIKAVVRKHTGRDLPMFATELGFNDDGDPTQEILQARAHIRSSLILLGEGYRFHMPFSTYLPGYGFYYSLQGGSYFPDKAGPKSVVPAYAAMTFLVDGHKSAGPIQGLGDKAWGYTYRGPEDTIKALWSETARQVTVAVRGDQIEVFDWMGNGELVPTSSGKLGVTIGPNPIYVKTAPGPADK